jgi:hypothetical protein
MARGYPRRAYAAVEAIGHDAGFDAIDRRLGETLGRLAESRHRARG